MWRHLLVTMIHCLHLGDTTTFMRICKQKTNQKSVFISVHRLLSWQQLVVTAQNVCERNKSAVHHHINTHSLSVSPLPIITSCPGSTPQHNAVDVSMEALTSVWECDPCDPSDVGLMPPSVHGEYCSTKYWQSTQVQRGRKQNYSCVFRFKIINIFALMKVYCLFYVMWLVC